MIDTATTRTRLSTVPPTHARTDRTPAVGLPAAPALPLVRGGAGGDAELAALIADIEANNARRVRRSSTRRLQVKPSTGETRHVVVRNTSVRRAGVPAADCDADGEALAAFVEALRRLHRLGKENGGPPVADEAGELGARLADHCRSGCSVTGVRIQGMRVGTGHRCQPLPLDVASTSRAIELPATPTVAGDLAGVFELPLSALGTRTPLQVQVSNVLGYVRPVVPLYVQVAFTLGLGDAAAQRTLAEPRGIFVYAEDLAPGDACDLRIDTAGLFEQLPGPAGLIRSAHLLVWLPRPTERPLPQPVQGACRRVA